MQVFMPFENPFYSLDCLDKIRLGKQRVEAFQLINTIKSNKKAWSNHPVTVMYRDFLPWLTAYYNLSLAIFERRGGHNNILESIKLECSVVTPPWIGNVEFHNSHKSNLLRKAIDDSNGIGRDNAKKRPSDELMIRLEEYGINKENTNPNLEYIWWR